MDVFEFDKCLLDRLEESMNVLSWKDEVIPASQVRSEWSYYIELQIEPAGWQALWKIPRVICEELHVRYPTVVFGYVEQVLFKELKAIFIVQEVQDDDVHLPERHEVYLEDLWPTKQQENSELNIERTADCIDRLRFFYTHVWMSWDNDNDDDLNWVEKHLESRIRFCYDLRKRTMKKTLAAHIRKLLAESKYLQQRREYLELGLTDEDDLEGDLEKTMDKTEVTDLMRLHLRLAIIRNEIELLENPEMRRIYQEIKFPEDKYFKNVENSDRINKKKRERLFFVLMPYTLDQQIDFMQIAKQSVSKNALVQNVPSLQEVLNTCSSYDCIYLSPGRHTVKFLENMNDGGKISGLQAIKGKLKKSLDISSNENVILSSSDDESILFVFDGSFSLENIVIDCRNVRSGILIKSGTVSLRNCLLIGDGKTSTQQGIICNTGATVTLEECTIEDFATGLAIMDDAVLQLNNSSVINCKVGVDLNARSKSHFNQTKIINSQLNGINVVTMFKEQNCKIKHKTLSSLNEWNDHFDTIQPFIGECEFKNCKTNIYVLNIARLLISKNAFNNSRDNDDNVSNSPVKDYADIIAFI